MKHSTSLVLGLVLVLLVAACGDEAGADGSTTSSPPASDTPTTAVPGVTGSGDASDLVGSEWIVDRFSLGGVDVVLVPDADPSIVFSADGPEVGGTTGCNSYFGTIDYGPPGEITISQVGQTEMACFPDEVMAQEQQFTQALPTVRFYDIEGDRLTLVSEDGTVIITAVNRDSVEVPLELGDVTWIADTRIDRDAASTLVPGTGVTLTFDAALGNIGGNSGCNSFGATYVVDDDRIRVDDITGTERGCEPAVMDQEAFVYDVLANADTFTIDQGRLTIMTADGRGLSLTPSTTE